MVPAVGDRGTFILKSPWMIDQRGEYTCHAVRSFTELAASKLSVYDLFYKPKGISEQSYKLDAEAGVVIVALRSSSSTYIYVPSSYIIGVPNGNGYAYSRRLLTLDFGALPVGLSTEALRTDLSTFVNAKFGVNPTIKEVELPISEIVTPDNHKALENGRKGRITDAGNLETRYNNLLKAFNEIQTENAGHVSKLIELGVIEL